MTSDDNAQDPPSGSAGERAPLDPTAAAERSASGPGSKSAAGVEGRSINKLLENHRLGCRIFVGLPLIVIGFATAGDTLHSLFATGGKAAVGGIFGVALGIYAGASYLGGEIGVWMWGRTLRERKVSHHALIAFLRTHADDDSGEAVIKILFERRRDRSLDSGDIARLLSDNRVNLKLKLRTLKQMNHEPGLFRDAAPEMKEIEVSDAGLKRKLEKTIRAIESSGEGGPE